MSNEPLYLVFHCIVEAVECLLIDYTVLENGCVLLNVLFNYYSEWNCFDCSVIIWSIAIWTVHWMSLGKLTW